MNRALNRVATLILLLLAVFPQIYLIAESLECIISPSLAIWILIFCILTWIGASFHRGYLITLPACALALFGAYQLLGGGLKEQLYDFFDKITGAYYMHFYAPDSDYAFANSVSSHTLLLVFIAFVLAAYAASSLTSRFARISLTMLGTFPVFAGCIAVNGDPSYVLVIVMLLFFFLLSISGASYDPEGNGGRTVLLSILPLALLLSGLLWLCHPEEYDYEREGLRVSRQVDWMYDLLDVWWKGETVEQGVMPGSAQGTDADGSVQPVEDAESYQASWDDANSGMDLTQSYDREDADDVILRVRAESSGVLYLRISSFGDYTGAGWLNADTPNAGSSLAFTGSGAASGHGTRRSVEIRANQRMEALALPYYHTMDSESDAYVPSSAEKNYETVYYAVPSVNGLRVSEELAERELAYRAFAHEYYTKLPDSTKAVMLSLCGEAGLSADDPDIISAVASYVQSVGEYDLNAGSYPSDDYAVYFLTEDHHGYCIHFATAAAALYRSLGIPARVADGFLTETRAGRFTDVIGWDAHAWVEIYQDGLGWIPVEVTGRTGEGQLEGPSEEEPQVTQAPEEQTTAPSPTPLPGADPSAPPLPVGVIQQEDEAVPLGIKALSFLRKALPFLLAAALLCAAIPLWHTGAKLRYRRLIRQRDGRKAIVAMWHYATVLTRYGAEIPELIRTCAEKAVFSQHSLSREELFACREELEDLVMETYAGLKGFSRFRFKYLHGFV